MDVRQHEAAAQRVLAPPTRAAIFLVVTIRPGSEADVRAGLAEVAGLTRSVGFRDRESALSCVVGIGAEAWDRTYDQAPPDGLHPFVALDGGQHQAPSTPGDLLFHIRCARLDMCFELAHQLVRLLRDQVDVVDEVHAFRYFDQRDLLGFVDGTENPEGAEATAAVLIDEGPWAGSSFVVVQKYVHDMDAWAAISVEEQERVIGRTKLDDIELDDDVQPSNSHVALTSITDPDGTDREIVRDNLAFGKVGDAEFGTYFIGYAADLDVTEEMLRRMFLGDPPGNYDRILDFSTAVTGGLFFVPPAAFLDDPDAFGVPEPEVVDEPSNTSPGDGSLAIGSLKKE